MKLSFSSCGWSKTGWQELCELAKSTGFDGIEIHEQWQPLYSGTKLLDPSVANAAKRDLVEKKLTIPCLDIHSDLADGTKKKENIKAITDALTVAKRLNIPCLRLSVYSEGEAADKNVRAVIKATISDARKLGVTLLVETIGIYADTTRLCKLLDFFASDTLGAVWDIHHTCREAKETPSETVKRLGAYIKHVHLKDSSVSDTGEISYHLIGEGTLPIADVMRALYSINYDGFISLEWKPFWSETELELELVALHFINHIKRFGDTARQTKKRRLYENKSGTGKFPWQKDKLIDCTFGKVLDRMVEEFPDQYVFKYTTLDYTRTYSEFREDVDEFARVLVSLGVRPGHHVAIWATNLPQWYITFWATVKIGAVLVSVNTAYKIAEAEYLFRQSDTHTLVMIEGYKDSNYKEIMQQLCPELEKTKAGEPMSCKRLPFLRNIITVGFQMDGALSWDEALRRAENVPIEEINRFANAVDIHDVCNMQYTSGTTGFPKGVMLTHYNVVNNGKCIGDRMDLSTADRMMIQVPMFHCFGMVLAMTASMTHGATLSPLPYFSTRASLACINQERITCFHGVPTMFIAMMEHPDFEKTNFEYMRTGIMAGSPCPISKMRDVVDKMNMKEITIVYGETEASPGCTMSQADDPLEIRVATVGRPLPEIECRIVDPETGMELGDEQVGEFVARGYNIMKGYYKMPEATAEAIDSDGWLHTGDLACRTPEGNFRITGRLKDMIIRGGENIYPKEIEEFLYTHAKVRDVQVIGVPDEGLGEEIMACIILKDGETATEKEIKDYVAQNMAKHKVPRYIAFMTEFPMNVAGKILKYQLRKNAIQALGLEKAAGIKTA